MQQELPQVELEKRSQGGVREEEEEELNVAQIKNATIKRNEEIMRREEENAFNV